MFDVVYICMVYVSALYVVRACCGLCVMCNGYVSVCSVCEFVEAGDRGGQRAWPGL